MDILGKVISIKSNGQFPSKGHEPVTLLCSVKKGEQNASVKPTCFQHFDLEKTHT